MQETEVTSIDVEGRHVTLPTQVAIGTRMILAGRTFLFKRKAVAEFKDAGRDKPGTPLYHYFWVETP
jgi:hypothetical protein